jgi:hypothetical protein
LRSTFIVDQRCDNCGATDDSPCEVRGLLSARTLARSGLDNNLGGFLEADLARIDDKMVLMRIRNIHAEVAAEILFADAVGFFDVFGRLLFT